MKVDKLVREFKYGSLALADINPAQSPQEVKDFYSSVYPELNNAEIEGPEPKGGKMVYEFRKAVGTKGIVVAADSNGVFLIDRERARQIEKLGWTPKHDDEHRRGDLALVALCYAAPLPVFVMEKHSDGFKFADPWPASWDESYDKRPLDDNSNGPLDPRRYDNKLRIRNLVKAGALIAAEIDRLHRLEAKRGKKRKA